MELTEHLTKLLAGDDPVASVTQFLKTEIDAAYQENITVSTRESRATECSWDRGGECSLLCCTKTCYLFLPFRVFQQPPQQPPQEDPEKGLGKLMYSKELVYSYQLQSLLLLTILWT